MPRCEFYGPVAETGGHSRVGGQLSARPYSTAHT